MPSNHNYLQIITKGHAVSTNEIYTRKVYNIWNYYRAGGLATPSKSAAITAFLSSTLAPLLSALSVSYVVDNIDYRSLDDTADPYDSQTSTSHGAISGDSTPSCMNVTLQCKTGV